MHPGLADIVADALPEPAASLATEARFLMCPPRHYAVSYSINPRMNPVSWKSGGSALHEEAEQQWFALHDTLLALGAAIDFIDPEPNLPDLVFTANAAIVLDGKALLARFRLPERQGEEPIFGAALLALRERIEIDSIMEMPEGIWLEGAGDCIWDRAPAVLDGLRSTLAPRGGTCRFGKFRRRMRGIGVVRSELLSPRYRFLSPALGRLDLLPWRILQNRAARH